MSSLSNSTGFKRVLECTELQGHKSTDWSVADMVSVTVTFNPDIMDSHRIFAEYSSIYTILEQQMNPLSARMEGAVLVCVFSLQVPYHFSCSLLYLLKDILFITKLQN